MRNLRRLAAMTAVGGFFDSQVVAQLETGTFLRTEIAGRKRVLGRHRHQVAQLYFVLSGQVDVEVGAADCHAEAGDLVIIPAGFSHMARNPGQVPVVMLEAFVPAASPIDPAAELCDRDEGEPEAECLRTWDPATLAREPDLGLAWQWLVPPADGAADLAAAVIRHDPGNPGVELHVHDRDQVHVVLSGALTTDIAGIEVIGGEHDLIFVPAGVPHAFGNPGPEPTTHLHLHLPGSASDRPRWGSPVSFRLL